jgi:hypothetical protein
MSILCQDIITRVRQALDAEENPTNPQLGYYNDSIDIIPNINNAIKWLISVAASLLEEKKYSSEIFRELSYTRIFETSRFSRIGFSASALGHDVWTVLAVYPEPVTYPGNPPIVFGPAYQSGYQNAESFMSGTKTAKRLTLEEWNSNATNPLEAGNIIFTNTNAPSLISYAFLEFSNYGGTNYTPTVVQEIEVRPQILNLYCGVVYIAVPPLVTLGTDNIAFPLTCTNIIYEKTLKLISQKIGDGTTIATASDEELSELIKTIA